MLINFEIPSGWEVDSIGNNCKTYSGGTPSRSIPEYFEGNIPWLKSGELNQIRVLYTEENISEAGFNNSSAKYVKPGVLLYALYGATAGVIAISEIKAAINQAILAIIPNEKLINEYLFQYLTANKKRILSKYVQGGQPNLSAEIIKSLQIPIPPMHEQATIAKILSCWDFVIAKIQNLVIKKQQLKKGLMQQLLCGKRRFPEFKEKWKVVSLGKIFSEVTEKVGDRKYTTLSITAGVGFVTQEEKFGKDISGRQYSNYVLISEGDFCYNKGFSKTYNQGCVYKLKTHKQAAAPNAYISFRKKDSKICDSFYEQWFIADFHARQLKKYISSGARGDGLINLNKGDFFKIIAPYPSLEEQKKIASVLATCDQEISLLQAQAEALKKQKRGLMQKLLTGQIRVKV